MSHDSRVGGLYRKLMRSYGQPRGQWRIWCKRRKTLRDRERILIEAILVQRTSWRNVELTIDRLHEAGVWSVRELFQRFHSSRQKLHRILRPSGFYRAKARCLLSLASFVLQNRGIRLLMKREYHVLRSELRALPGIGSETADSILLYALDKPAFVIDEYTRRMVKRERLTRGISDDALQNFFQRSLPRDIRLYQDYHALIVIHEQQQR